jgi:heterodisulfide reductase subunit A2
MSNQANIGVFLCQCGDKIAPYVELAALTKEMSSLPNVTYCAAMPFPCLKPGMDEMTRVVKEMGLNRVIVAGCEGRLMMKKFEDGLYPCGLLKGQIDMINIRGHVAAVSDASPEIKAQKAARLLKASVAEMRALAPTLQTQAHFEGPVIILGEGISSFSAAKEVASQGIDCLLSLTEKDPDSIIRNLHRRFPGERAEFDRLRTLIKEVLENPKVRLLPPGRLSKLSGVTGDYTLTFSEPPGGPGVSYRAGAIITCLDADLESPMPGYGHDGETVMHQSEMEEHIWNKGYPKGRVIFWVNDYELGFPEFAQLSSRNAWTMAINIREKSPSTKVTILYNEQMAIPLTAAERAIGRRLEIIWAPYDKALTPTVQDKFITFCNLTDHVEHEFPWDYIVLSPVRNVTGETLRIAQILGIAHKEGRFLTGHHAKVRPDMVGREESYLAGSARLPCLLSDALAKGKRAGKKTAEMLQKAKLGELHVPRIVCVVDPAKCIGCGQCQELCDCGGIGVVDGQSGGLPRVVDPMVCTGGGTCAAACPYNALVLQNSSNDQREAKVAALSKQLGDADILAFACAWGGLPAADIAGSHHLPYDPAIHIVGIPCVGQLDPSVFARAFVEGAPGVLLVGCLPGECHHSHGVDHAWNRVDLLKKLLMLSGFDRRRIALAHADLNKPEEFVKTVNSFARVIKSLGPIEKTPENIEKLESIYELVRNNTRIRHLLSANLRRPSETVFKGNQQHALSYDRDFIQALTEEFLQTRLLHLLKLRNRPLKLNEMAGTLREEETKIASCLWDMVYAGSVDCKHSSREPLYVLNN